MEDEDFDFEQEESGALSKVVVSHILRFFDRWNAVEADLTDEDVQVKVDMIFAILPTWRVSSSWKDHEGYKLNSIEFIITWLGLKPSRTVSWHAKVSFRDLNLEFSHGFGACGSESLLIFVELCRF